MKLQNRKRTRNVSVYNSRQRRQDENNFKKGLNNGVVRWREFQRLVLSDLILHDNILETKEILHIPLNRIQHAMSHPLHSWRLLLQVSQHLMLVSPFYYELSNYYSNMASINYGIDLYGVSDSLTKDRLRKMYEGVAEKLEKMNLQHEFLKIIKYLPYQDIFYGLVVSNKQNWFIMQVDPYICKLYQIQDGLYTYVIDLSKISPMDLQCYPDYVQQAWLNFHSKDSEQGVYYYPPVNKQICIKWNYQFTQPFPFLLQLLRDILDTDTYKNLRLQSERTNNLKYIAMKVPIDESQVDKPLLSPELLSVFSDMDRQALSDDVGIIHGLGVEPKAISFENSNTVSDNVDKSINNIYDSAGTNSTLFNGASNATAVKMSLEQDAGYLYQVYRQFERWVNMMLRVENYNKANCSFHFYILDETIYTKSDIISRYKDASSMGFFPDRYVASLGVTPAQMLSSGRLTDDVFDFYNKLKPLRTSYNSSDIGGTVGRPEEDDVTDSGEDTRDRETNKDR